MSVHLSTALPLLIDIKIITVKIFLWVFLSLTLPGLEKKIKGVTNARYVHPIILQHRITFNQS